MGALEKNPAREPASHVARFGRWVLCHVSSQVFLIFGVFATLFRALAKPNSLPSSLSFSPRPATEKVVRLFTSPCLRSLTVQHPFSCVRLRRDLCRAVPTIPCSGLPSAASRWFLSRTISLFLFSFLFASRFVFFVFVFVFVLFFSLASLLPLPDPNLDP